MLLISHRGNLNGPNSELENSPEYIESALKQGFDVETDIWANGSELFLGHDQPQYKINLDFLNSYKDRLFIHCKSLEALDYMSNLDGFNYFWHQNDDYTLTSKGYIWTYPNKSVTKKNILVIKEKINKDKLPNCLGICSDYVFLYK